ncbi:hypothetical protein SPBR_03136 [Sporothrix brasiliensis 5110]|uniref:Uncharacterized protein n=1 Tax=Sporothrix brasiliensis 5110 TaxID=1398154 RepID=A0A0C2FPA9_9PEZI|nr:uncharacterized protein SPBR_03136 [Sporothrix brasiliensis 5110]KIH92903.1 hypothetical protein SPBR_03136 [Sporothrix brasiliensis 5110]
MRPFVAIAAIVAIATASPFRLLSLPPVSTPASAEMAAKDKGALVDDFDQNKQHQENQDHKIHQTVKLTHHRLPLRGLEHGYGYRLQRSNTSPGKAVVYVPVRASAPKGTTTEAPHATHDTVADKHRLHSRVADSADAAGLTAPPPCQPMSPPPDETATKERFGKFANAFLVTKNITEAFTYISEGYINHNPAAKNGAASAWGILSPIWASQNITVLRTTFKGNYGWLNYRAGGFGEVVDRYRWDAGCIVEHSTCCEPML